MSRPLQTNRKISRNRLTQLLQRRQVEPLSPTEESASAPSFDWTCPHHFGPHEWQIMHSLGKKIAISIENALGPICLESPQVSMKKIAQDFANVLVTKASSEEMQPYFLPFSGVSKRPEGFLSIPVESAGVLVAQMLRDPESVVGRDGVFSKLEESILQDAAVVVIDAILTMLREHGLTALKENERMMRGDWPLEYIRMEDICGFTFSLAFAKNTIELTMLMLGDVLDVALGVVRSQKTFAPAELSRRITRQLHNAPVEITARLCESSISMQDLMVLEPGDVLMLGKKTDEPIEALLNNCLCFYAWPVECEGKLSLMVAHSGKQ